MAGLNDDVRDHFQRFSDKTRVRRTPMNIRRLISIAIVHCVCVCRMPMCNEF